jgi:hypothetical protein
MSKQESTRRKFMKTAGLVVGGSLIAKGSMANPLNEDEILKLNPAQNEFMKRYSLWMDEFTEVVRLQKKDPYNEEFRLRMEALTHQSHDFKPELSEHMKDNTFNLIYLESIKRVRDEI